MMKLSGWKRQTGALAVMPMVISQLGGQFLGWDTQDMDKWLMILATFGLPLWGVGWIDKVLPFTTKIEKVLEIFNAWAAKHRSQAGATTADVLKTTGAIAGVVVVALTGNGIQDKALEEKVAADIEKKIQAVDDSLAVVDSTNDFKCDSVNAANVSPARYAAVRPEKDGFHLTDKLNPLYYHTPDEFVVVKTYRGKQGSKDTVLIGEQFIEADKRWLLAVKAEAVMENPVSTDAGTMVDPIETIPDGTK